MSVTVEELSFNGRQAMRVGDWNSVDACASELLKIDTENPEAYYFLGRAEKAAKHPVAATEHFEKALFLDERRYDAGIELASQYVISLRNSEAIALLEKYTPHLGNSPLYLDVAGTIYSDIGLSQKALPLYKKACQLQPEIDLFQANLAACSVFVGEIAEAKAIYQALLRKRPTHQRNHYYLSRLDKAKDDVHIEQMKTVLETTNLSPDKNIFMHYALGKELEDVERWSEAFDHYKRAGDAVSSVSNYQIETDEALINKIKEVCSEDWINEPVARIGTEIQNKTPIFILGLPRTGTTLTERILSSHSLVESIGETTYLESVLRMQSEVPSYEKMIPEMLDALETKDISEIANDYLNAASFLFGEKPMFIEKLPYNFLYIGFIAKAFPDAKIIRLMRNPMDSCFSMYKQPFTWAYKYSYRQEDLGRYFVAQDGLWKHWKSVLGDRIIEVKYEALVSDQENQTRGLLEKLGLDFEQACLDFDQNQTASATASSVQVREKIHSRSVLRWKEFESELSELRQILNDAGVALE